MNRAYNTDEPHPAMERRIAAALYESCADTQRGRGWIKDLGEGFILRWSRYHAYTVIQGLEIGPDGQLCYQGYGYEFWHDQLDRLKADHRDRCEGMGHRWPDLDPKEIAHLVVVMGLIAPADSKGDRHVG